jgi:hypothetical protein
VDGRWVGGVRTFMPWAREAMRMGLSARKVRRARRKLVGSFSNALALDPMNVVTCTGQRMRVLPQRDGAGSSGRGFESSLCRWVVGAKAPAGHPAKHSHTGLAASTRHGTCLSACGRSSVTPLVLVLMMALVPGWVLEQLKSMRRVALHRPNVLTSTAPCPS